MLSLIFFLTFDGHAACVKRVDSNLVRTRDKGRRMNWFEYLKRAKPDLMYHVVT